eukprot:m.100011 g.100011  ORF g.100011 m.100011 type:complete len:108 (-) comp14047_c0_seq5:1254-1577(-)
MYVCVCVCYCMDTTSLAPHPSPQPVRRELGWLGDQAQRFPPQLLQLDARAVFAELLSQKGKSAQNASVGGAVLCTTAGGVKNFSDHPDALHQSIDVFLGRHKLVIFN